MLQTQIVSTGTLIPTPMPIRKGVLLPNNLRGRPIGVASVDCSVDVGPLLVDVGPVREKVVKSLGSGRAIEKD